MSKFANLKYFNVSEFDSPDELGSGEKMSSELLEILDGMRDEAGFSFRITSGYRSKAHNKKVGGVEGSSHRKGLAVDILCVDSRKRFKIIELAIAYGITRIGIRKDFIHLDIDDDKAPSVVWLY